MLAAIDVVKVECSGPEGEDMESIFNLKVLEGSIKLRAPDEEARVLWLVRLVAQQRPRYFRRSHAYSSLDAACFRRRACRMTLWTISRAP